MFKSNYTINIERMMYAYHLALSPGSSGCCDPISKHSMWPHLFGKQIDLSPAKQEDIDEVLHELAWLLEENRPYNYIEVANSFPICTQSIVAQFDDNPRSGVTYFCHTRKVSMCCMCYETLRKRVTKFRESYPNIIEILSCRGLYLLGVPQNMEVEHGN